jgi:hypothetical protein
MTIAASHSFLENEQVPFLFAGLDQPVPKRHTWGNWQFGRPLTGGNNVPAHSEQAVECDTCGSVDLVNDVDIGICVLMPLSRSIREDVGHEVGLPCEPLDACLRGLVLGQVRLDLLGAHKLEPASHMPGNGSPQVAVLGAGLWSPSLPEALDAVDDVLVVDVQPDRTLNVVEEMGDCE